MSSSVVAFKGGQPKDELIQLVSFNIDHEEYAVEVLKVREIIRMTTITQMPGTPHYIEGIINLRGKVIPIVSLRKKFGLMDTGTDTSTRIIVMDIDGELMGFIVDSVSEVTRISSGEIQPPPSMVGGGVDHDCITGVINQSDRLLVLLDLDSLFSAEEKLLFSQM